MLLDQLEEQLNLLAAVIKLRYGWGRQIEVVRQGHQRLALGVLDADAAQRLRVVPDPLELGQRAVLVADDAAGPVQRLRVAPLETQVRLGVDDEEALGLVQSMQFLEVVVAPIHDIEGNGIRNQHVEDIDHAPLAVADVDEARNVALQFEWRMHLHRSFGAAKRPPRKHRQTQVDGRRIQGIDRLGQIDAEGFVDIQPAGNADQTLGEVGIDAPIPDRFRVRQCVSGYRVAKAHVVELGRPYL